MLVKRSFNLVHNPWIMVLETATNKEKLVSLQELFANAKNYRQLAGDTRSQDLAILRFLLAILTTVYSRVDGNDQPYDGLEIDDNFRVIDAEDFCEDFSEEDALETWHTLFAKGTFTPAVAHYLDGVADRFDFLGNQPFYQVTREEYNTFVNGEDSRISSNRKSKGTVAVRQINRLISESNNKTTIFSAKSDRYKDKVSIDELVRWIITYQNFAGVTDKGKVSNDSKSPGWLYKLNPIFTVGNNLFETLLFNLVLYEDNELWSPIQNPVWEHINNNYINKVKENKIPNNIAELYTLWARMIHIEWNDDKPIIYVAKLPMPSMTNAFIEPMTIWRKTDKKSKDVRPATRNLGQLGQAMWQNFGQYVRTSGNENVPGIVNWLEGVTKNHPDMLVTLSTAVLVSDKNATSQSPAAEFTDDFALNREVIFDDEMMRRWPERIENIVEVTRNVGKEYKKLVYQIAYIRGLTDREKFANYIQAKFYERLNNPFKEWLFNLRANDDRDLKQREWMRELKKVVNTSLKEDIERIATPRDFRGYKEEKNGRKKRGYTNIFIEVNLFRKRVARYFKED